MSPPRRRLLRGQREIARAELVAVPNPAPNRDYVISCVSPEFTCLCPISGFPDFATIRLRYVPERSIVELKSLKLYVNRFRDEHVFHEAVINRICDDLVTCITPRWIEVVGDFHVRGNIKTVITVVRRADGYLHSPDVAATLAVTVPSGATT